MELSGLELHELKVLNAKKRPLPVLPTSPNPYLAPCYLSWIQRHRGFPGHNGGRGTHSQLVGLGICYFCHTVLQHAHSRHLQPTQKKCNACAAMLESKRLAVHTQWQLEYGSRAWVQGGSPQLTACISSRGEGCSSVSLPWMNLSPLLSITPLTSWFHRRN